MKDIMTKKDIVVELIRSMTPEQRQQILTEEFQKEFEREVTAEIDRRIKQKADQGDDTVDQGKGEE